MPFTFEFIVTHFCCWSLLLDICIKALIIVQCYKQQTDEYSWLFKEFSHSFKLSNFFIYARDNIQFILKPGEMQVEKTRLITNLIIIPAPLFCPHSQNTPTSVCRPEQSHHESDQRASIPPLDNPTNISVAIKRKYPKDDYQKNITINVVKCCIREILGHKFSTVLNRKCEKFGVRLEALREMVGPIIKQVVISLGDLKQMLTRGQEEGEEGKLKLIFSWFMEWYLRNRYMHYLLFEGKMNHKERYVEYKNKYLLYLIRIARENRQIFSPIRIVQSKANIEEMEL